MNLQGLISKIILEDSHIHDLTQHAKTTWPHEACAILIGTLKDGTALVDYVVLTENDDKSFTSFTVNIDKLLEIYEQVDYECKEIVGIFHSHPAPPEPSEVDIKFMRLNPVVWFIMSMPRTEYVAYQWRDGGIATIKIENQ